MVYRTHSTLEVYFHLTLLLISHSVSDRSECGCLAGQFTDLCKAPRISLLGSDPETNRRLHQEDLGV